MKAQLQVTGKLPVQELQLHTKLMNFYTFISFYAWYCKERDMLLIVKFLR